MLKWQSWLLAFFLTFFLFPGAQASGPEDAVIQKAFTLYDGSKGNPYTMFYPFELNRPGQISILVRTWDLDPDPKNQNFEPLQLILVDGRAFKEMNPEEWHQWIQKANKYNPVEWLAGDQIRGFVKGMKTLLGKKEKPPAYYHGGIALGREGTSESFKHAVDMPELAATAGRYVAIFRNMAPFNAEGAIMIRYPGDE